MSEAVEWVKQHPVLYRAGRSTRLWAGRHLARPRALPGVPGKVHPNDLMVAWGRGDKAAAYARGGRRCVSLVEESLALCDRSVADVRSWLDFGCGYGRVLRHLVLTVAPGRMWAADVDPEAVRFCASEFGVQPVDVSNGPTVLEGERFDMIYAFSVLTHLPEQAGLDLMARFGRSLLPGGLLLFTTHGETSLGLVEHHGRWLPGHAPTIRAEVGDAGFSYRPYPHYRGDGYGMAWHAAGYVRDAMTRLHGDSLALVRHVPDALEGLQDTFVYQRR